MEKYQRGQNQKQSFCEKEFFWILDLSYEHAEESDEASESGVAPEDVELVPQVLGHHDREEEDDKSQQREEVAHVLDYSDPDENIFESLFKSCWF